jgi:hypothetical protein
VSQDCEGTAAKRPSVAGFKATSALALGDYRLPQLSNFQAGALLAMQHNGRDHALTVTADGKGLAGHAGAVLLRKAAGQAGLTAQLSSALRNNSASPLLDRGIVLAAMAAAIALGATSMSDIALLAHLAPVPGAAPSGPTVRRALDLAGTPAMLDRIARARRGRSRCAPGHAGHPAHPAPRRNGHEAEKRMPAQSVTGPQAT